MTLIFLISSGAFGLVMLKAGFTFTHHAYYIIPFTPVMALFIGHALNSIRQQKWAWAILLIICLEGILNQQHDFRVHGKELALLELEQHMDQISDRNDLILINSGAYPTPMYFAARRGWVLKNEEIGPAILDSLHHLGLRHVVVLKRTFGSEMPIDRPVVFENENYRIHRMVNSEGHPVPPGSFR